MPLSIGIDARTTNPVNKERKNLGAAWQWGRDNLRGWPEGEHPFLAVARRPEIRKPRYVPPESDSWAVFVHVAGKAVETGDDADIQTVLRHKSAKTTARLRTLWD